MKPGTKAGTVSVLVLIAAAVHGLDSGASATSHPAAHGGGGGHRRAVVIAYARAQEGKPYVWGGTGPDGNPPSPGYDCSGLAMEAFAAAGIHLLRTSQQQFAEGPRISASQVRPGDLVFFAGSDGTAAAPGHVGIVVSPARHTMIEAYATGFSVRQSHYGTAAAAPGDSPVVGYTDPYEGGS